MQDPRTGALESEALLKALLGEWERRITVSQESLTALFVAVDTNLDGLINQEELAVILKFAGGKEMEGKLDLMWEEALKVQQQSRVMRLYTRGSKGLGCCVACGH